MQKIIIEQGYENSTYISDLYELLADSHEVSGSGPDADKGKIFFYSQYLQAAKCIDVITMNADTFYC